MKPIMVVIFILGWGEVHANGITFLGLNESGQELSQTFNPAEYEQYLTATFSALEEVADQQSTVLPLSNGKFKLTQFSLGIGAQGEIGFAPFKFGAGIRHRAFYKKASL